VGRTSGGVASAGGASLAYVNYVSGSTTYTITTTTPGTAVDTTNLTLAGVVAPASGAVEVSVSAFVIRTNNGTINFAQSLVTHLTTTQVCQFMTLGDNTTLSGLNQSCTTAVFIVTGLTPGNTYQWDLAAWQTGAGGSSYVIYASTSNGAVTMVARAL